MARKELDPQIAELLGNAEQFIMNEVVLNIPANQRKPFLVNLPEKRINHVAAESITYQHKNDLQLGFFYCMVAAKDKGLTINEVYWAMASPPVQQNVRAERVVKRFENALEEVINISPKIKSTNDLTERKGSQNTAVSIDTGLGDMRSIDSAISTESIVDSMRLGKIEQRLENIETLLQSSHFGQDHGETSIETMLKQELSPIREDIHALKTAGQAVPESKLSSIEETVPKYMACDEEIKEMTIKKKDNKKVSGKSVKLFKFWKKK